jgi:hypothetical protein
MHISRQLSLLNDYVIIRKYNEINYRDRGQKLTKIKQKHSTMTSGAQIYLFLVKRPGTLPPRTSCSVCRGPREFLEIRHIA